jgi:phosphate transport system permease protein
MIYFGMRASLLGGIIAIALLILPMLIRSMDEVIRLVPRELMEASYALGATRWETAMKVVARQALPGILTAVLIAFGRGIGDAAAVIFTAGFTDSIPDSLLRPVATLPLAIFFQLGSPLPEVQGRAYAAALVLTILILIVSLGSRLIGKRLTRHVIR